MDRRMTEIKNNNSNSVELEEITNFDESYYLVKNYTAEPSINDKTIVCNIYIKTLNMPALTEWEDEKKPFVSELYIVPKLEFITQQCKDKIFDSMDFDEFLKTYGDIFAQMEIINYGLGIRLSGGFESFATEKEAIDALKKDVQAISMLIGFYMDKSWNQIGTTGWDTLNELVHNKDQFKESMNRISTQTEDLKNC